MAALRSYEHTSYEQEQAAGKAIVSDEKLADNDQVATTDVKSSEKKSPMDSDVQEAESSLKSILPTFSGKMENCTINFHFNHVGLFELSGFVFVYS